MYPFSRIRPEVCTPGIYHSFPHEKLLEFTVAFEHFEKYMAAHSTIWKFMKANQQILLGGIYYDLYIWQSVLMLILLALRLQTLA